MTRRRGRPPKSDEVATGDRLLDAATEACVSDGFDGVTVAGIAERAGVTATAIYNHFATKEELLYRAGRRALDELAATLSSNGTPTGTVHDVAVAFLRPELAPTRRLLLELHMAAARHPELAEHLAEWHKEFARLFASVAPGPPEEQRATMKALFLLLLGLCHLEQLDAIRADRNRLAAQVDRMVGTLYPAEARTR
jgi:AcrR family transcriptional regulator